MLAFSGVVLAGGASRRMGADKATLVIEDSTLLDRVVDALRAAGADDVLVVGGARETAEATGARFEPDRWPGEGPLGGLITGLSSVTTDVAIVAACDLPDIDPGIVRDLLSVLDSDEKLDAVVPLVDGRSQPLLAAYRRRCADALTPIFVTGQRRMDEALDELAVERPVRVGPSFRDLDTPDDLAARRRSHHSPAHLDTRDDLTSNEAFAPFPGTRLRSGAMNAGVPAVDVHALSAALSEGALLLDVREPDEYAEAHVAVGRLVPLQTVPAAVGELPLDQPVYVICRSGGRSHNAAVFLREQGIDAINVLGGTLAWIAADLPVATGAGD